MATHNLTLPMVIDTYINQDSPNTNYKSSTLLQTRHNAYDSSNNNIFMLFKPNVSTIPAFKKLKSLTLHAYTTTGYPSLFGIKLFSSNAAITGNETYNSHNLSMYGGGSFDGSSSSASSNSWVSYIYGINNFNILNNGFAIQVMIQNDYGTIMSFHSMENTNKPYIVITYDDAPPLKPQNLTPSSNYLANTNINRFDWDYITDINDTQAKFDLKWRLVGNPTWTTVTQTTSNTYYDMPANTLPSGQIEWTVNTYNSYNEISPTSDITRFYCVGAPSIPTVSINPIARPFISWSSAQQKAFDLNIFDSLNNLIYERVNQAGVGVFTHQVKDFLVDGDYELKIRVRNEYGFFSPWSNTPFTISSIKPTKPTLTITSNQDANTLAVTFNTPNYLVYRKAEDETSYRLIAKSNLGTYLDKTIKSGVLYSYFVRAYNTTAFNDSDVKNNLTTFKYSILSDFNEDLIIKYRLNTDVDRQISLNKAYTLNHYVGRNYPIAELRTEKEESMGIAFYIALNELDKLKRIISSQVIYRSEVGHLIIGVVSGAVVKEVFGKQLKGYEVSLIIHKTDYTEGVEI